MRVGRDRTCEAVSIGVTGVTDRPFRARAVEEMLRGRPLDDNLLEAAASGVTRDVDVTDSIQGSKAYRSALAKLYVVRATRAAT
jgi:carbon-monoxide dehydrogenase medium subunit